MAPCYSWWSTAGSSRSAQKDRGGPCLEAAALTGRGQLRRCSPRRPNQLTENHSIRSAKTFRAAQMVPRLSFVEHHQRLFLRHDFRVRGAISSLRSRSERVVD